MNLRKMKHVKKRNVVIRNGIAFGRILPLPLGWIRSIIWWIVLSIVTILLLADWPVETDGRLVEFCLAMFAVCLLTPVLALEFLCDYHYALNVAMFAYVFHALLILILARTHCRMIQILIIGILAVQSVLGVYGLFNSI